MDYAFIGSRENREVFMSTSHEADGCFSSAVAVEATETPAANVPRQENMNSSVFEN